MILHPSFVLPVMPNETPMSYASRTAMGVGIPLRSFCTRTGIPFQKLIDGFPCAIASLCDVCQLPQSTFAETTFVAASGNRLILAGQTFLQDQANRDALRVCPACVEEQLAEGRGFEEIHSPREWSVTPLHVCDVHSVPVQTIILPGSRLRLDFAARLREASRQGLIPPRSTELVPESGLGYHIRDRLAGVKVDHWLSRLPLYAAIKTAQTIGILAMHGARQRMVDLPPSARFEAGRAGYDILNEGEAGLRRVFTECQRTSNAEASTAGLKKTFGRMYFILSQGGDAAYDPLRDVLRRHIVETMPFGPGDTVLGQEVSERRLHSPLTVAPELGLSVPTANKRLRFIGVLDETSEELFMSQRTFDARVHAKDVRRLAGALQRAEAGRYLGLHRVGDLTEILDMIGSMNIDKSRLVDQIFAKEDLDAFVALVRSKALPGPAKPDVEPILKVSRRTQKSVADILLMILQGEVANVGVSEAHPGIMSVMVLKDEVMKSVISRRSWITLTAGAKAIKMKDTTLGALVRNKIIPSIGTRPLMLKPEDLQSFKQTYISQREITREYRSMRTRDNPLSVTRAMSEAGLEPAFDERKTVLKFYRRDAVLAAFGPPPS